MSDEIQVNLSVRVEKANKLWSFTPGQFTQDLTTARRGGNDQLIGLTPEVLTDGDVAAPRLCVLRNLDATNYVTVGPQSSTTATMEPTMRIPAGASVLLWLDPTVVLMAMANTAAVNLEVNIWDT